MHPAIVRALLLPMHEFLLHRPTLRYWKRMEGSQWLSREDMEGLQRDSLQALLEGANCHSPWHAARIRAARIDPRSSRLLADFKALPTMDRADASLHRETLVWREAPGGVFPYSTGGSSGTPLIFFFGRKRQAADAACRFRARRWWGHEVGEREVLLWGAPVELAKADAVRTIRDRLFNQLLLNAFDMSTESMDRYLDVIERFQPRCLYGYASSLALLAAHARSRSRRPRLPALRVIFATGETLYPQQRQLLGEVFGAPVANEYGCRDGGLIALESPEGQMLVNSEAVILEVLDASGAPAAPGEIGEAVVTNLYSEAQPFIRYRTGDLVRQAQGSCIGGRGLQVIGEVMGRQTDFIVCADGKIVHALALIHVLRPIAGIGEFKVIQHAFDRFDLLVKPDLDWQSDSVPAIVRRLRDRLGDGVRIDVHLRDEIPVEASGKHRYVVSHVPLPKELDFTG